MSTNNKEKASLVIEYVKSAGLKGTVKIISDDEFLWDIGGVFLRFLIDNRETTVFYSRRESRTFTIGHFHEDTSEAIRLIQKINRKENRVHIAALIGGSNFEIENHTEKKKKSWLFVRHYYSQL